MLNKLMMAALLGFALSAILGALLLPALRRFKAGQPIKEDGPVWHISKQGTPTMGGISFILAVLIVILVVAGNVILDGNLSALAIFLFSLVFGVIGFLDDYEKVKKKHNTGLSAAQKFLLQIAVAIVFLVLLRNNGLINPNLYVPFWGIEWKLNWLTYMAFAAIVMVGTVNAVNLTDGVDGLVTGVSLPVCAFFAAVAYHQYSLKDQMQALGVGIFATALFGSLLGFLIYNFNPAKVFMGDTGSLFLGGAICGMAFALNIPLILPLVGLIYVAEAMSDIIQVVYFKLTKGKRFFLMAPLHHHYEKKGWSEKKLFFVFSSITVICCIIAYYGVVDMYPVSLP